MLNAGDFHITTICYKTAQEKKPINELTNFPEIHSWYYQKSGCLHPKKRVDVIYFPRTLLPTYEKYYIFSCPGSPVPTTAEWVYELK